MARCQPLTELRVERRYSLSTPCSRSCGLSLLSDWKAGRARRRKCCTLCRTLCACGRFGWQKLLACFALLFAPHPPALTLRGTVATTQGPCLVPPTHGQARSGEHQQHDPVGATTQHYGALRASKSSHSASVGCGLHGTHSKQRHGVNTKLLQMVIILTYTPPSCPLPPRESLMMSSMLPSMPHHPWRAWSA